MEKSSVKTKLAFRVTHGILHIVLTIAFYCLVAFIVFRACKATYEFSYQIFGNVTVTDEAHKYDREVVIAESESTMSVARKLELYKIAKNKYSFYVRAKLGDESIKPGTYILSSDMDYDDILTIITDTSKEK